MVELEVRETLGFVPSMRCFPRVWEKLPPAWSGDRPMRRVRTESLAFTARFDARVATDQDENWLLQLLSPEFVDWLNEAPQEQFGFELHEGVLRCFTPGHVAGADAERLIAEAERVARRVRDEALESEGLGVRELGLGTPKRIERALAKVSFDEPPPDSSVASRPFRRFAALDPRVYVAALGGIVTGFAVLFWLLFEIGFDAIDLIIEIVSWIGPKGTGVGLGIFVFVAWLAALPEAISIASRSYGRVAFAREYARDRGYSLESPQSFHRRLMRVELPAPAQVVMRGSVAGRREGRLVLCRSGRGPFSSYADAVVFPVGERPEGRGFGDGFAIAVGARHLVVSRDSGADRYAKQLDELAEHAVGLLERLEAGELALHPTGGPADAPVRRTPA